MIGVIVLSGPSEGMHGLDAQRSPTLLPLGDRPALQHIIESLVTQGITTIELIVCHAPERVEALLGNGDRWGCRFRYHLVAQPDRPYRSLKVIPSLDLEPWVLIHAEQYPCVDFPAQPDNAGVLYFGEFLLPPQNMEPSTEIPQSTWGGAVALPPTTITDTFANYTFPELRDHLLQLAADGSASIVADAEWVDVSTPSRLLQSQRKLLDKELPGLLISGTERETGVWISRNVTIHSSVGLIPPLYIGPNSRLNKGVQAGPYAVIGADCIIDTNTVIEDSLVVEGSYVGEALELQDAIVSHNLLVNVRLDASVDIAEEFLLGRLDRPNRDLGAAGLFQSALALVLFIVCLPFTLLATLYCWLFLKLPLTSLDATPLPFDDENPTIHGYALPCLGVDAWTVPRSAGWSAFIRQFLPGMLAVMRGHLNFVGLPPQTKAELDGLSSDWRAIYSVGRAGLITERSTAVTDGNDEMQLYLADAYYSVRRSFGYDLRLALRYFWCLIVPRRQSTPSRPEPAADLPAPSSTFETK